MRRLIGIAVVAAALSVSPRAGADDIKDWLAEGKDALAKGEWEGRRTFESKPSGGAAQPVAPGTPGTTTGGGTSTPPPETDGGSAPGGVTTGGGTAQPSGDDEDPPVGAPGTTTGGTPAPAPAGGSTPPPAPGPLPTCTSHWVLEEKQEKPDLVDEETLLTLTLFRNDAFGYICNGYCRSESTWYVDWFATTSAGHADHKEYEVTLRLEGQCPNCSPSIEMNGTSYLAAKAAIHSGGGGISASSSARAAASAVWTGDLDGSGSCDARVANLLTGGEASLELAGLKISDKGTRTDASESATGGKGDSITKYASLAYQKVTNKGDVSTYAAGALDNCQAKVMAGQTFTFTARADCGAMATYELVLEKK